ncbi:glycosyltransferase family 1 protein [Campylobacter sp. FMV-PI01]|uniref:Glycosyltransferase family 1 protein n=1 Tax=Campylobacter portucalensis TaxID=2608384 RepID=A0A6L5WK89_9BACT|nr:glycosyltransferase [Campylobacter portucalensis]MSN96171.1 glycosyltransferase family 1 protein [Campylobacter portucalensis]
MMNYYERFNSDKFHITFFTSKNSSDIPYDWLEKNDIKLITFDADKKINIFCTLLKVIKKLNIKIIHSNEPNFLIFLAAYFCGVKARLIHSHLFIKNSTKTLKNKLHLYLINLLATNRIACGKLAGIDMFGDRDFIYVKNAININKFMFNPKIKYEIMSDLNLENKIVFGCIARLEEQKNHKFLLEVFSHIKDLILNSHLILIGDGKLRKDLENQAKSLNLSDDVSFIGSVENPEIYYNAMDCFLLTSFFEGFPVVLVEAQTNGLKCFVSDEISNEVKILDSLEFLPLNKGAKFWAKHIVNSYNSTKFKRDDLATQKIKNEGFDIDFEAKKLQDFYEKLL